MPGWSPLLQWWVTGSFAGILGRHKAWGQYPTIAFRLSAARTWLLRALGRLSGVPERTALTPTLGWGDGVTAGCPPQPCAVTFQPPDSGRAGRGAGRRRRRPVGPGGGTRKHPPRLEPPCNRRRPEPSCAGPRHPPAMGDEDDDEGCAVELRITEGGCGIWR